jgi:hypothetical protein
VIFAAEADAASDVTSIVKTVERDDAIFFWFLGQGVDG